MNSHMNRHLRRLRMRMTAMRNNKPSSRVLFAGLTTLLLICFLLFRNSDGASSISRWSLRDSSLGRLTGHDTHQRAGTLAATSHKLEKGSSTTVELGRASNGTLGVWHHLLSSLLFDTLTFGSTQFEKILVLGLKDRSDKRDAMVLSSSLTGFEVEFVDAVKGDEITAKARPEVRLTVTPTPEEAYIVFRVQSY